MNNKELNDLPLRVPKLKSMTDLLRAMNRIHREARLKQLSTADLGRYANFYNMFANMLRDGDLEKRLEQLEDMQGLPRQGGKHDVSKQH